MQTLAVTVLTVNIAGFCCLQSVLNLTVTVARNAIKLQAGNGASSSPPLLDSGLYRAAACAACNHKDVAASSLTCMSSILGKLMGSSFRHEHCLSTLHKQIVRFNSFLVQRQAAAVASKVGASWYTELDKALFRACWQLCLLSQPWQGYTKCAVSS